jgi:hypothetical protein
MPPAAAEPQDAPQAPSAPAEEPAPGVHGEEPLTPAERPWREQLERFSIDRLSQTLAHAGDRREIAEALLRYFGQEFDRAAIFLIKADEASGWRARHLGKEVEDFRLVHLPLSRPSVLKTVAEGKSFYLGALAETPLNERMLAGLGGGRPQTALLVPVLLGGRAVIVLYAEGGKAELGSRLAELQKLAGKAALAFEILIARDKILMG